MQDMPLTPLLVLLVFVLVPLINLLLSGVRRSFATQSSRERANLRRAILLMAVLGPCRADDSSDAERWQFPSELREP